MATGAGFLTAVQIANGQAAAGPVRTVTINVSNGATGPTGPQGLKGEAGPTGPAGPKGDKGDPGSGGGPCEGAPTDYSPGFLKINSPGGQVTIWTCLEP